MSVFRCFCFFLISHYSYSQTVETEVRRTIKTMQNKELADITVLLFKNQNIIGSARTDINGKFLFQTEISNGNQYSLKIDYLNRDFGHTIFRTLEDTIVYGTYDITMQFYPQKEERFDPSIYFDFNNVKDFQNHEDDLFKALILEFPEICIAFSQTINPEENREIVTERMNYFKQHLIQEGFDMKNFKFSNNIYLLDEFEQDKRSRIQGVVVSVEGNCE